MTNQGSGLTYMKRNLTSEIAFGYRITITAGI